jgi:hypothetical protein
VHGDFGNFLIPEVTFSAHLYEAVAMHLQSLNLSSGNMMLDRERREWTYDFSLFFKEKLLSPTDFIPLSLYNIVNLKLSHVGSTFYMVAILNF